MMVDVLRKPISPKRKPPNTEPMTPTIRLPSNPNPPPLVNLPASQPAAKPINKNQSTLIEREDGIVESGESDYPKIGWIKDPPTSVKRSSRPLCKRVRRK